MKLPKILALGWLTLANFIAIPTNAAEIATHAFDSSTFRQITFLEKIGLSKDIAISISNYFSLQNILSNLQSFSSLLNILFVILVISLVVFLRKIINQTPQEEKFINRLRLVPEAITKDSFEFFNKYCKRLSDGTFECSYSDYSKYHSLTKLSLNTALAALWLKIAVVVILLILNAGFLKAYEGLTSANYEIFIDSQLAGGGVLTSSNYTADMSFGEAIAAPRGTSGGGYSETSGISNILDEVSIGISWGNATNLNFGITSTGATEYGYHTLSAYYNGQNGYDITVQGNTPTYSTHSITPIGATAVTPSAGTEQFGINLRGNTVPGVVGADPVGGYGTAVGQYAIINKYAWNPGDIIATSTQMSPETVYTVSVIMNVAPLTPAGSYVTHLLYSMVPKF